MALIDAVYPLIGLVYGTVGVYLLAFRPLGRNVAVLGVALVANALTYALDGPGPLATFLSDLTGFVTIVGFAAFFALYPRPLRWQSASGVACGLVLLWGLGAAFLLVTTRAVAPIMGFQLGNLTLLVLMLTRLLELHSPLDREGRAARYFYLAPLGFSFTGGGFLIAWSICSALGLGPYPRFLYTDAGLDATIASFLTWWILPAAIVVAALVRWRWWTPALLVLVGAASFLMIVLPRGLDGPTLGPVAVWGELVTPTFVLYAQARWAPFDGEPGGARPALLVTALSALLAYVSVFVLVLIASPDETFGFVAGPVLGLAAAIGMAALVLPRARRLALRRAFVATSQGPAAILDAGAIILGRYAIVRLIAEGGQGRVYEAIDKRRHGARVVLKVVTSEDAVREARIMRGLRHANIVRFVDLVEATGLTLLVLEYAEGGSLRGLLTRRGGRLPPAEAHAVARGVLSGLAEAHARGVVHRDVKPENVLLDAAGEPMLADFGAAREARAGATIQVGGLGTLAYLAPEQVRGEPGDARADVYAVAVLIHEIHTGERPIPMKGDDDFLMRRAILMEAPLLSLGAAEASLALVLHRALAKDPAARFANAGEMLAAMSRYG